jgi:hypothetical protein
MKRWPGILFCRRPRVTGADRFGDSSTSGRADVSVGYWRSFVWLGAGQSAQCGGCGGPDIAVRVGQAGREPGSGVRLADSAKRGGRVRPHLWRYVVQRGP